MGFGAFEPAYAGFNPCLHLFGPCSLLSPHRRPLNPAGARQLLLRLLGLSAGAAGHVGGAGAAAAAGP
jgi:hypothetical protein